MPSVGMRRSTRVFGARVLRSGKRLLTEPREGSKYMKAPIEENEWIGSPDKSARVEGGASHHCPDVLPENEKGTPMDIVEAAVKEIAAEGELEVKNVDRMWGIVYQRKRKRAESVSTGLPEDKRYGKKFARKQWRKKRRVTEPVENSVNIDSSVNRPPELAVYAYQLSYGSSFWISRFLTSVLNYMMNHRLWMQQLSSFVLSKPIFDAYYSHGVLFLQDSSTIEGPGVCVISGSSSLIPLFTVDFSAVPDCFMYMHSSIYIRSLRFSCRVAPMLDLVARDEKMIDVADDVKKPSFQVLFGGDQSEILAVASPISSEGDRPDSDMVPYPNDDPGKAESSLSVVGLRKTALRGLQLRNSRKIQKRRSSLRLKKRARAASTFRAQKNSGALSSDFLRVKNNGGRFSTAAPTRVHRSSYKRSFNVDLIEAKSNGSVLTHDTGGVSCSANLLITETDKCYREEGAIIILDQSASRQWFLAIMKDGIMRYSLTAEKVMRPSCCNRFTHATVWAVDGCWKLEFPNKQDWLIFKDLYKECCDRNMQAPAASVIPVPGVVEVSSPFDNDHPSFVRPDSYITVKGDELTRVLARKGANYDMDSDDENWLNKFNEKLLEENELQQCITPERFELIIDTLEKGINCNDNEYFDVQAASDVLTPIEKKEVVEPIRSYWIKKRKQKHCSLVRIFQLYQSRRNQVIPKPVLRKKRSFRRKPSQGGRGKHRTLLQAMADERVALERRNNLHKVQEAKAAANRFEELAVLKRQRAQMLMENADLATYKAVIALRIAEAAQVTESMETVASFFLG